MRLTDEEVARFAAQRFRFPGVEIKARLFRTTRWARPAPPDRLHRPHQPEGKGAHRGLGRRRQLPRHRLHRQAGRGAELRAQLHGTTGVERWNLGRRPPCGAWPAAGHAGQRSCCRSTSSCRRWWKTCTAAAAARWWPSTRATARCWPGQQAHLRPQPVRRRHRPGKLGRAQRLARQAAAQPRAARHLPAGLHLQALHGLAALETGKRTPHRRHGRRLLDLRRPHLPLGPRAGAGGPAPRHRQSSNVYFYSWPTTWAWTPSTTS
jgi:hypothetical protein